MPSLLRESQDILPPPPPQQQQASSSVPSTLKTNEKRKHHSTTTTALPPSKTKRTKKKDPNEPKHSRTAYNFYVKHALPQLTTGTHRTTTAAVSGTSVNTLLGEQWRGMSVEDKLPYERMACEDKRRYIEERAVYDQKNRGADQKLLVKEESSHEQGGSSVEVVSVAKKENGGVVIVHDGASQPASQKSIECVELKKSIESVEENMLLVEDLQEKIGTLKTSFTTDNDVIPSNDGNKENNSTTTTATTTRKVGKGFIGKAKSEVARLFSTKLGKGSHKQKSCSQPKTVVRAGSYQAVVRTSSNSEESKIVGEEEDEGCVVVAEGDGGRREKKWGGGMNEVDKKSDRTVQATAHLEELKVSNDDDDGTRSQHSADLLSECCEDDETPIAANTSNKKETSLDPPQAPANLVKLTLLPLNRDACASALKKLKGCPHEQPDYIAPVPEKDQNMVRKTIVLEEKDDGNSDATSLDEVTLGRSAVTGIKSTLVSRQLCTLSMNGKTASITMLKASEQHAVFLNGEPLGEPVGKERGLKDQDILSLYGPVDFAYRIQLSL